MDAITLLKEDHKTVEKLFKRYEKAGDRAFVEKREIVDRIIEELSKHAAIEEQLFYPVTRATVDEVEDIALESLEEHHIVKWVLSELETMDPAEERFDAKVTVLMENVRHHVEEEETDYFPKVRSAIGRNGLAELGDAMKDAKATAPTHPHPEAPDTPPGNLIAGGAAAAVDRVGDTVKGLAKGSMDVVADLVARIQNKSVSRPSPTGSSTARKTAAKTRAAGNDAADRATKAVNEARRTGEEVTERAKRTAKATSTSARRGAKNTATTAKRTAKTPTR
jgi:hemerythrin superfamily protein